MITNILLGLILIVLCFIAFMLFIIGDKTCGDKKWLNIAVKKIFMTAFII